MSDFFFQYPMFIRLFMAHKKQHHWPFRMNKVDKKVKSAGIQHKVQVGMCVYLQFKSVCALAKADNLHRVHTGKIV